MYDSISSLQEAKTTKMLFSEERKKGMENVRTAEFGQR